MLKRLLGPLALALLVGALAFLWWRRPPADRPPADDGSGAALVMPDYGDEWPRFRGPAGLGIAPRARPPIKWSATENLRWKTPLPGAGASSPIVWGDRVFVTCWTGEDASLARQLVCVNRANGSIRWTKEEPAAQPEDAYTGYLTEHGYATNTACTDGERVYVFHGKTGVIAYSMDGEEKWRAEVGKQSSNRRWGSAASLLLAGENVIVNAAEESRAILALDRHTGKQVWKAPARSLELSFGTPVLLPAGKTHQLILAVPGQLWGLNPANGGLIWHADIGLEQNVAPSIAAADGVIFASGGHPKRNIVAVKLGGEILWDKGGASYVPSPVASGGNVFLVTEKGIALCLNAATGETTGKRRLTSGTVYASPLLANGNLYCVTRKGGCIVVEATPELKKLAVNHFSDDDSDFNASPAASKDELFLRSDRYLYCVAPEKP